MPGLLKKPPALSPGWRFSFFWTAQISAVVKATKKPAEGGLYRVKPIKLGVNQLDAGAHRFVGKG